jgi:antibiotic biosynthesis monooxygenase (ABM) superfamily enzyme
VDVTTRLRTLRPVRMAGNTVLREPVDRSAQPVTVTAARVVRPEQRAAFEQWAAEVEELVAGFPGHLGSTLLHPGTDGDEYHLVYRFRDSEALSFWERSAERHAALLRVRGLVRDERYARAVGLQSFFTVPPQAGPRWRMTLLSIAAVFALTSTFQLVAVPVLGHWPWPLRLLVSACFVVTMLGYVMMPRLTRVFARWLHPHD